MPCGSQDVHLEIHSTLDALDLVQAVTEHIARRLGFDDESLHWTTMAVRESVVNAISHGNDNDPAKIVFIDYTATPESDPVDFTVSVRDQGAGFDPETIKDPLTPENMLSTSGRGVFLIRQFMDEVLMRRVPEGGMEVRMTKRIRPRE
jgi:serine/threonine-protein kinase RsbW